MRVKYAEHVISMFGTLPPGTLWVNGYLDDASEAVRTLKRHAARKRREAKRKLAVKKQKLSATRRTKLKRSR